MASNDVNESTAIKNTLQLFSAKLDMKAKARHALLIKLGKCKMADSLNHKTETTNYEINIQSVSPSHIQLLFEACVQSEAIVIAAI